MLLLLMIQHPCNELCLTMLLCAQLKSSSNPYFKRIKRNAPSLPPLKDQGGRIHDMYGSKKNEAWRKAREQTERKDETRRILSLTGSKLEL